MTQQSAASLLEGGVQLFSLPDIYFQVSEMVSDTRFSLKDIGQVIAKDPALSTRLLKIVNSPIYGYQGRIDTISRAIVVVGIEDLNNLVLATSVVDNFKDIPSELVDMTAFWMHSVNCGVLAKMLAKKSAVLHSERLFLSGLLHNIGSLIMFYKMPEQSKRVLQQVGENRSKITALETEVFGFTHADVSAELIKSWGMPESLYESISCHLQPDRAQVHRLDSHLLSLAVSLSNAMESSADITAFVDSLDDNALTLMRLDRKQIKDISAQVTNEFPEIFDLLAPNKKFH